MRTYKSSNWENLDKSSLRGGFISREEKLRKFYRKNQSKIEPELLDTIAKKGITGVKNVEDYFVESVISRTELTLNASLEISEIQDDVVNKRIPISEGAERIKKIRENNIENVSKSDFDKALKDTMSIDVYRDWGVDNYMKSWFEKIDPSQQGTKPKGGKYSKDMKQMMRDTKWRGTKEDWLSLEWDPSTKGFIYTNKKGEKWRFGFTDSPKTAFYEKV